MHKVVAIILGLATLRYLLVAVCFTLNAMFEANVAMKWLHIQNARTYYLRFLIALVATSTYITLFCK